MTSPFQKQFGDPNYQPPLVAGCVYGIRRYYAYPQYSSGFAFIPDMEITDSRPPLRGMMELWKTKSMTARCRMAASHRAPEERCTCGIYGYWSQDLMEAPGRGVLFAAVRAEGRVVLGTKGFRAEKVTILGMSTYSVPHLTFSTINSRLLQQVQDYYQVPIFPSLLRLTRKFPPTLDYYVPDYSSFSMKVKKFMGNVIDQIPWWYEGD